MKTQRLVKQLFASYHLFFSYRVLAASCALVAWMTVAAGAVTENYGTFNGADVTFQDVTEMSPNDPLPLFGEPLAAGNSLVFRPNEFYSASVDPAGGFDVTDSQLRTTITANPGMAIDAIMIEEAGDYTIIGPPGSSASAQVAGAVHIRVLEIDGLSVSGPADSTNIPFTPSGGVFDLSGGIGAAVIFEGDLLIDVTALVADSGAAGRATMLELTLDNVLGTMNQPGTAVLIKKKDIGVGARMVNNPEPSSILLIAVGLVGLIGYTQRRRRARSH